MRRLYRVVEKNANWPTITLLFVAFLLCNQAFAWRQSRLEHEVLDVRSWYTPGEVAELMESLGADGRSLYATTQVTLDVAFPLIYGAILAILIVRLYREELARRLLAVPLVAVLADLLENVTAAFLAWTFTDEASSLAWFSAVCTLTKSAALLGALVVVLVGAVRRLLRPATTS